MNIKAILSGYTLQSTEVDAKGCTMATFTNKDGNRLQYHTKKEWESEPIAYKAICKFMGHR